MESTASERVLATIPARAAAAQRRRRLRRGAPGLERDDLAPAGRHRSGRVGGRGGRGPRDRARRRPAGLDPRRRPQRRRPGGRRRGARDRPVGDERRDRRSRSSARQGRRAAPSGATSTRPAQAHGLATPGGVVSETGRRRPHAERRPRLAAPQARPQLRRAARRRRWSPPTAGSCTRAPTSTPTCSGDSAGGGGNFGVVTEFEFELYPVGPTVATTVSIWPIDAAAAVLAEFRDLAPSLPDEISPVAVLSPVPDDEAFPEASAAATGCSSSPSPPPGRRGRPSAPPDRRARVVARRSTSAGEAAYAEFQQFFDAEYPAHTMRYYWKSSFADDLSAGIIDRLVEAFRRRPSHHSTIDIWANLGAIARVSSDDSAFGQRTSPWLVSPESNWEPADDDAAEPGLGARDRGRRRRQRLPQLPGPARGRRAAGEDEPRRDLRSPGRR